MTIGLDGAVPRQQPPAEGFPVTVGWTPAAMAVQAVLALNTPVHLRMTIEGHDPLLIDFRHHAFSWSTPLEQFPVDAVHTRLETIPTSPEAPPFFQLPGQHLDGLLWEMGINAFEGRAAFWLEPGDRYRLTRWPNLTQHSHNLSHVRMIAVLGNAYASAAELAKFADVEVSEAQRLINALSLMRILVRSSEVPAATMAPQTAAAKKQSLFTRLRERMGR
jgi:hypothetical protein